MRKPGVFISVPALCLLELALVLVIAFQVFRWTSPWAKFHNEFADAESEIKFFALVCDSAGQPVADASLQIRIESVSWRSLFGPFTPSMKPITLRTDGQGRCRLVGKSGLKLWVDAVSHDGYRWFAPRPEECHQLSYQFSKDATFGSCYQADETRPATFVLIRGEPPSHVAVSRGGSDLIIGGTIVRNDPVEALVPRNFSSGKP